MKWVAILVVAAGSLLFLGCGDADGGNDSPETAAAKPTTAAAPTTTTAARAEEMVGCLEDATYAVEAQDPGEYQVTRSEGGSIVANIDVLPNAAAARKFESQLAVDYVGGQTAVAVLLAEADDSDARLIEDCLP